MSRDIKIPFISPDLYFRRDLRNFSENRFSVLILRYWFIYIFDIDTFLIRKYILITTFFNRFIYLLQNLNNFVSFKTPIVERWLIQMKRPVAAPALLVLSRVLFMIDCMTAGIEVVSKMARSRTMTVFPQQYTYASGPIFVKLANDFNPSCLSTTFARKNVSPIEHMKLKGPSIKLV